MQPSGKLLIKFLGFSTSSEIFVKEKCKPYCHKMFMNIGEIHVVIVIENNLLTFHEIFRSSRKELMVPFFLVHFQNQDAYLLCRRHRSLNLLNPIQKQN